MIVKSGMMIGCGSGRDQFLPAMCQCRLRASAVISVMPILAGGSSMPPLGLQSSHGTPAPQSQASARWLVLSQIKHAIGYKIGPRGLHCESAPLRRAEAANLLGGGLH